MNALERRLLSNVIHAVRTHNNHAWWQLKREVHDYGYENYYPAQSFFETRAEEALGALRPPEMRQLRLAWSGKGIAPAHDLDLRKHYAREVVLEIVRRARLAAVRTLDW